MVWILATGLAVAVALLCYLAFPTAGRLQARRRAFTSATLAYVDPALFEAFDSVTRRMSRLGAVLLLMLVVGVGFSVEADVAPAVVAIPLLTVALGLVMGHRLLSAGREFPVSGVRSAVARPRQVVVSDYVSPLIQTLTWAAATMSVAIAVMALVAWRQDQFDATPAAVTVLGATLTSMMAVIAHGFGRAICGRPSPAVDPSHLYLQDAWRANDLTWAYTAVCYGIFILCSGIQSHVSVDGPEWFFRATLWLGLIAVAIMLMSSIARFRTQRHFRRRLWRTLSPGQVLLPGQQVPPRVGAGA